MFNKFECGKPRASLEVAACEMHLRLAIANSNIKGTSDIALSYIILKNTDENTSFVDVLEKLQRDVNPLRF